MRSVRKSFRRLSPPAFALAVLVAFPAMVTAASHLWVINEVFSSPDGTVQFIEMHVPTSSANETNMNTKWVESATTTQQFVFPENLPAGSTAFAYLLLATPSFAELPGAVEPDYVLPESFFDLDSDTIRWWLYGTGDLTFGPGDLPLDGVSSLHRDGSTAPNSPTNFNGETGSIDLGSSSVDPEGGPAAALAFWASPVDGGFDLTFETEASEARLVLHDVSGRIVRHLFEGAVHGVTQVGWNGRDDRGEPLASGVYFAHLEAGERRAVRKLALVR